MKSYLFLPKILLSRVVLVAICCLFIDSPAFAQFAGGSGTPANPYQVATSQQLNAIRNKPNATYILIADIDLSGLPFAPIENFGGSFDGNGHVVSNWTYSDNTKLQVGFFAAIYDNGTTKISNLTLANVQITGGCVIGALVGLNYGTIINCHVSGTVAGTTDATAILGVPATGGLVGRSNAPIMQCTSAANVSSAGYYTGGLAGQSVGRITECSSTGSINGGCSTGGLVGQNGGIIEGSSSTSAVVGLVYVGGLAGESGGSICTSLATGSVTGLEDVGGLVGVHGSGFISNCAAKGSVTATVMGYGGLIGQLSSSASLNNSYSTGQVCEGGGDSSAVQMIMPHPSFLAIGIRRRAGRP
jgi:hypothetical protein